MGLIRMIVCPNCGSSAVAGSRVCPACGAAFVAAPFHTRDAAALPVPGTGLASVAAAGARPVPDERRVTWSARELAAAMAALFVLLVAAWLINFDRPSVASLLSGRPQVSGEHPRNGSLLRLGTGDVQITVIWQENVDLDLHVIDPLGDHIWFSARDSRSGGHLDVDANAGCMPSEMMTNPVENVYWPYGGAPSGHYVVMVNYFADCVLQGPTSFTVKVKVGDSNQTFTGTLNRQGDTQQVTQFDR